MKVLVIVAVIAVCCIIAYGFGVVDTLNDIRTKCPDLYNAIKARVEEDDHATD